MPYREEHSTAHATGIITQVDGYLHWEFDKGGVKIEGREVIGDEGMNAALHRARTAIDTAANAPVEVVQAASEVAAVEPAKVVPAPKADTKKAEATK